MREESQERTKDEEDSLLVVESAREYPFGVEKSGREKRRRDVLVSVRRNGRGSAPRSE